MTAATQFPEILPFVGSSFTTHDVIDMALGNLQPKVATNTPFAITLPNFMPSACHTSLGCRLFGTFPLHQFE